MPDALFPPGSALEMRFVDHEAFLEALLGHIAARIEAGEREIEVDMTGVVSMPPTFLEALESAAVTTDMVGSQLLFRVSPELDRAIDDAGFEARVPHVAVPSTPVSEGPPIEVRDQTLVLRELDDSRLLEAFDEHFSRLLASEPAIRIDLTHLPYLSQRLCTSLVICAIQAREADKLFRVSATPAQQSTLHAQPGAEYLGLDPPPAPPESARQAGQAVRGASGGAHRAPSERRSTIRLRLSNAYVMYPRGGLEGSPRVKTRLVDISRGGLAFLSAQPIATGSRLPVYLELPAFLDLVRVLGEVVNQAQLPVDGGMVVWRTGIRFVDVPPTLVDGLLELERRETTTRRKADLQG